MSQRAQVCIRHWTSWPVDELLAECLQALGGIERFVHAGQVVVIKPNITADAPSESGGTTHVELVEALVRLVQPCAPGRLVVAEGTGKFGIQQETAFLHGGWREMAARTGVELYNLDAGPHRDISLPNGRYGKPLPVAELILDCDVLITVPCLKTHPSCDYTVSIKNGFSHIHQLKRSEVHSEYRIEEVLTDLARIRKPDLCVVDAWDGAEGVAGGTNFDHPAGARLLLAGADPVAVDVVSREVMGLHAPTRYLNWAIQDGVGCGRPGADRRGGRSAGRVPAPFSHPPRRAAATHQERHPLRPGRLQRLPHRGGDDALSLL